MPRHDVAIYAPEAVDWYEKSGGRGGGAERQMTLLARQLASRGLHVAHIVFEPRDPEVLPPRLTLVRRAGYPQRGSFGRVRELARIWRALTRSDARVTVVRAATPAVGLAALHCRLHRRALVFSSSNDSNFAPSGAPRNPLSRALYRLGVRLANVVVVQSRDQVRLAADYLGRDGDIVHIPSFCEPVDEAPERDGPRPLVWIGRVTATKAPLRYVELARALPQGRFFMVAVELQAEREYRELIEAARDVPNLELRDRLPHPQLMELIARALAVVNTSESEGLPNVFLEAWARGVPVLTLKCDPDRIVEERELGIASGGSWERFVAGGRELLDGRFPRADVARRARAYIEDVHSLDAVAARWAELLVAAAGGARRPRSSSDDGRPRAG